MGVRGLEDEGEGDRNKGEGKGIFILEDKGLLDREKTGLAHRNVAVYKGTRGKPKLG